MKRRCCTCRKEVEEGRTSKGTRNFFCNNSKCKMFTKKVTAWYKY